MAEHIVWDWNGTLFDDTHLVVASVNAVMAHVGLDAITDTDYRRHYTRPVSLFYERIFGRPIAADEWPVLDDAYHHAYNGRVEEALLVDGAHETIAALASRGRTQSLLSMWRHHQLVPTVQRLGLGDTFVRVDGLRGPGGGHKASYLEAHLTALRDEHGHLIDPRDVLLIGDAVDDANAAAHVGARCVLFDGGSHDRHHLEAVGVPIVDDLRDLIDLVA